MNRFALVVLAVILSGCGGGGGGSSTPALTTDSGTLRSVNVSERYDYLVSGTFADTGRQVSVWGALSTVIRQDGAVLDKTGRISLTLTPSGAPAESFIAAFHSYFAQDTDRSIYYRGEAVGPRNVQVSSPAEGVRRFKSPLRVGDAWQVSPQYVDAPSPGLFSAEVAGRQSITVPAGAFDCHIVSTVVNDYSRTYRIKYWITPQVGLPVRVSLRLNDSDANLNLELMGYPGRSRYDAPELPPDTGGPGALPTVPSPDAAPAPSLPPLQQRAAEFVVRMLG